MNKRNRYFLLSILFLAFSVLAACGGESASNDGESKNGDSSSSNEKIKLRVTSALAPTHGQWEGFFVPWMDQVMEESDGRVEFVTFTSGELVEAGNELDALNEGTVDIAAPLLPIYDPQRFPLSEVSMLPLTSSDPIIAGRAYNKLVTSDHKFSNGKTFQEMEYGEHGLKAFGPTISQEYSISTTGLEFNSTTDLKKAKLRTPSRIHEIYSKHVGINSVTMPTFDLFDAMSRGAIDGSYLFIADWTGYGFQDLFKYTVQGINLGHFGSVLAMTEEKWNSIPEDIQQIMIKAMDDHRDAGSQLWIDRSAEIIESTKAEGAKFVQLEDVNPEVKQTLEDGLVKTWHDFIDLLEEQGEPGKEVAILWRDYIIEEGGTVPEEVMDLK
ncbi:MAG: TRAP transporter substrate-binding protein DctP [Bacillota bacterium]